MKIRLIASIIFTLSVAVRLVAAPKPLTVYFIDTEGGAATLFVSPSGASMLVWWIPALQITTGATPNVSSPPRMMRASNRLIIS